MKGPRRVNYAKKFTIMIIDLPPEATAGQWNPNGIHNAPWTKHTVNIEYQKVVLTV